MNAVANRPIAHETLSRRRYARPLILVAADGTASSHAAYTAAELEPLLGHARRRHSNESGLALRTVRCC